MSLSPESLILIVSIGLWPLVLAWPNPVAWAWLFLMGGIGAGYAWRFHTTGL